MEPGKKNVSEKELEALIEQTTRHGAVYALMYFDAHAKDEETVKQLLVSFVGQLTREKGVLYCVGEVLEPRKHQAADGHYTSAEVKLLCDSFNTMVNICLRYAPVGVEIMAPSGDIRLSLDEAQTLLLDASQSTQDYTAHILKRILKPEDYAKFEEDLKRKAELGKELLERAAANKPEKQ